MRLLFLILILSFYTGCSEDKTLSQLEKIQNKGELIVITRLSPTTYYKGTHGKTGLEYELASRFAHHLGVKLKLIVPKNFDDIIPMIIRGEAHLAAAGLTITENRKKVVKFGPVYQKISQQLVYRLGSRRPKSIEDLLDGQLEVVAGSSHAERLVELSRIHPDLHWKESRGLSSQDLMDLVFEQVIDYTVADSNELKLFKRYNKEVNAAFSLTEPQSLAWAMPYHSDQTLYLETIKFFNELKKNGELEQLIERYYGHADQLNFVGTRLYLRHVKTKLPRYQNQFIRAAEKYDMDWRLLAAIGYQESHWKPEAISPTGVRGIMMLTQITAEQLKVTNRLDPGQSIEGGAKYFRYILDRIPERIDKPDRTWMALAAYNVGFYHLEDARILTSEAGSDPDKWIDVKKHLPLLSRKKWYKKTKYGFARGYEAVKYVENIRIYHDLLVWSSNNEKSLLDTPEPALPAIDSSVF